MAFPRRNEQRAAALRARPTEERDRIMAAVQEAFPIRWNPTFCPYVPTAKQLAFLAMDDVEVFYGGAAGPGKSFGLLMAAAQYVDVPDYAALLLRRTYGDLALPGALMDVAFEWWRGTGAKWRSGMKTWEFPSGATITFGHLEHEEQKRRYAGASFQFVGFDELTGFSQTQYEFLFSRLRKPNSSTRLAPDGTGIADVPLRMRSASNPGGPGHMWVRRKLVSPATRRSDAVFIPALLHENPHLDREAYERSLSHLGATERARLLKGDWSARDAGSLYDGQWLQMLERYEPSPDMRRVRYWDLAATEPGPSNPDPDYTVGLRYAWRPANAEEVRVTRLAAVPEGEHVPRGSFVVEHVVRFRKTSARVKQAVIDAAIADGPQVHVCIEQEPGSSGKAIVDDYARALPGHVVRGVRPTGDKETRARISAAAAENGLIYVVDDGSWDVDAFVDELEAFPGGEHDDQVDGLSGAHGEVAKAMPMTSSRPTGRLPARRSVG
jgi:predicted phage terminase large subunit-like protein